uniref:Ribonuclease P n=1 Tax=Rhabditophanes sp. KR3021 TaxID=114890 RepID=A0AC35UHK0_9BILA
MYVQSFSKLISQLKSLQAQKGYENIRFSSSKNDKDNCCVPTLKNFQHFLLGLVTGAQKSIDTGINELKFETRDKVCRVIVSRRIYEQLKKARVKKVQYNSSVTLSVYSDLMSTASK